MSIEAFFQYTIVTRDSFESAVLNDPFAAATAVGVAPSGNTLIDAVVAGYGRWSGQVTYSFPSNVSAYSGGYAAAVDGIQQVSVAQINAIRGILEGTGNIYCSVEAFCGLDIAQVADNTVQANVNLQISQCDNFDGSNLATARVGDFPGSPIYPGFPDAAGDVWFGDDSGSGADDGAQVFRNPVIGNYAWMTHIHELGHALGLQHSHDSVTGPFGAALPADRRDIEFSVMSYLSFNGAAPGYINEQFGFAQTFMMYDILALQYLYGADYSTNSGNTVYSWSPSTGQMFVDGVGQGLPGANRIFLTIWDGNGNDTYDMSNYSGGVSIDLRPEMWSVTSTAQLADLDWRTSDPSRVARGNVYNAALFDGDVRSLIENAIGGSGNDTLIANDFDCTLMGGGGNDILTGGAGIDRLIGGTGVDTLSGGGGADTFIFALGDSFAASGQHDRINGFIAGVDRIDLSGIDAIAASGTKDLFRFIGTSAFSGAAGELNYLYNSSLGVTVVQGDTNGDRFADFAIDLSGNVTLGAGDFIGAMLLPLVVIEALGSTSLVQIGSNYFLNGIGSGTGPQLKFASGAPYTAGQAGAWAPIGVEQTATGYEVAWRVVGADQYSVWVTDGNGKHITNSIGVVSGNSAAWQTIETRFHQDLNGNGVMGTPAGPITVIEAFGSTSLVQVGSNYFLNGTGSGTGPQLKFGGGAPYTVGQAGAWSPIGVEQTARGYEVAWKVAGTDQYSVWATDSNGMYISNVIGVVSGNSAAWESFETRFHQDLNGNGVMGTPAGPITVIEAFGSTSLVQVGSNYFLNGTGSGTGPQLKFGGGAPYTVGQAGAWSPIGVEQTATGYEVAWRVVGADQYSVWVTDSNGQHITNSIGVVSGDSAAWQTIETRFHQDLNGNGVMGTPAGPITVIEAFGSTGLVQVGSNYFLNGIGSGTGPQLKFAGGTPYTVGQAGTWSPIGVEQTATGYEVAWRAAGADQYSVWVTDSSGQHITNSIGVVSGNSAAWQTIETRFQQDLNGNGLIGSAAATVVNSAINMGQPAEAPSNEKPAFDAVHSLAESNVDGWLFKSVSPSGGAGIFEAGGHFLSGIGQLLTDILNDAQADRQNTAFKTEDGAHDTIGNHGGSMLAKALIADLHMDYLIIH